MLQFWYLCFFAVRRRQDTQYTEISHAEKKSLLRTLTTQIADTGLIYLPVLQKRYMYLYCNTLN